MSQPFHVAEKFTGVPGVYALLPETLRGFKMIIEGDLDDVPEAAFFNVGTVDDVLAKAKELQKQQEMDNLALGPVDKSKVAIR